MKMPIRSALLTASAGALLLSAGEAQALVSLALSDTVGAPQEVTLSPGDSFTLRLALTSTAESVLGLSYFLETVGAGSSQFRITGRSLATSPYTDLTTADSIALQASNALLDPINDSDLGATTDTATGTGTFVVADFTIQALSTLSTGADYVIRTAAGTATDSGFNDLPLAAASYTVHVVPEPTALSLAGLGLAAFLTRRQRRAR